MSSSVEQIQAMIRNVDTSFMIFKLFSMFRVKCDIQSSFMTCRLHSQYFSWFYGTHEKYLKWIFLLIIYALFVRIHCMQWKMSEWEICIRHCYNETDMAVDKMTAALFGCSTNNNVCITLCMKHFTRNDKLITYDKSPKTVTIFLIKDCLPIFKVTLHKRAHNGNN